MVTLGLKRLCGERDGGLFNSLWNFILKKQLLVIFYFFNETWVNSCKQWLLKVEKEQEGKIWSKVDKRER